MTSLWLINCALLRFIFILLQFARDQKSSLLLFSKQCYLECGRCQCVSLISVRSPKNIRRPPLTSTIMPLDHGKRQHAWDRYHRARRPPPIALFSSYLEIESELAAAETKNVNQNAVTDQVSSIGKHYWARNIIFFFSYHRLNGIYLDAIFE